jgi:hypothetical protein
MNPRIPPYQEGSESARPDRSQIMRRDNDTMKSPKITLYDIDYAIIYHLSESLRLKVQENGVMVDVPVMYASGEKWSQIREHGFMRADDKKVMAPVISIRRTSVVEDSRIPMLSTNLVTPRVKLFPYKTMNMQYDRRAGQSAMKPSHEYYLVGVPTFVKVSYDLIIWTDLMEQLNGIVQAIIATSDLVWGDYFRFRARVADFTIETVNTPGEDRLVKATATIDVDGRLREEFVFNEATMLKAYTLKRVTFLNEQEENDFYTGEIIPPADAHHLSQESHHDLQKNHRRNIRF